MDNPREIKPFVHLHVHSYYSVLDALSPVSKLVDAAYADGQPGLALTDHGVMFGIKEFTDYIAKKNDPVTSALKELKGRIETEGETPELLEEKKLLERQIFKPIIGCEVYFAKDGRFSKGTKSQVGADGKSRNKDYYHLILLAKNLTGYHNLAKLVSKGYTEGYHYKPRIDRELLEEFHEGLIATSACLGGEIPQLIMAGDLHGAKESILWFKSLFGEDYYLELQRHKTDKPHGNRNTFPKQEDVNRELLALGRELGVKCVATNDVHFAGEADAEAHERLICIGRNQTFEDPNRFHPYTKQEWLKGYDLMKEIFSDVPDALANTMEILDKVEVYSIEHAPLMPDFKIPEPFTSDAEYLRHLSYEGAKERYGDPLSDEVRERLDFELDTIITMGFPGYFLIVQDFIAAARRLGVIVGPGRGSAAGSIVSYCLRITDLDPLKYGLLFERFLNPDRISLPDIDVDFDDDGRQQILEWVTNTYGKDRVAHIVTFNTMAAKSAIKQVGKVVGLPFSETNVLSKQIPDRIEGVKKITVKASIDNVPELKSYYDAGGDEYETLKYAMQLEGTVSNTGVHACGIIIGKQPISDVVPVCTSTDKDTKEKILATQYEGSVIESTGLIKMDFLGLKTLSIIREALRNIKLSTGKELDIDRIPLDDELTYKLFQDGNTHAVFQFESPGMQKSLKQLKPSVFEDLIAMVALYRPGPMDNIPSFIARKHGEESIEYDLPVMEEYLRETYGITVYQEQVMLLSRAIAGFTRGESDNLRKAMGKKKLEMMAKLKVKFLSGGEANGYKAEILEKIWKEWEKFASYAFNKSHAACYAWVAYQTAYLKAHYPAEFLAGVMSRNLNDINEISKYIKECQKNGISVLGPDINESQGTFSVNKEGQVRFGLLGIKGINTSTVSGILKERDENGTFSDVYEVFSRLPVSVASQKKDFEMLVYTGAFDSFGTFTREDYLEETDGKDGRFLNALIKYNERTKGAAQVATQSLFGDEVMNEVSKPVLEAHASPWSDIERLNYEKQYLGLYLTASPLDKYALVLRHKCNMHGAEIGKWEEFAGKDVTFGGIVTGAREGTARNGNPFSIIKVQDFDGEGELPLFGEQFVKYGGFGREGLCILVRGRVNPAYNGTRFYFDVSSINLLDKVYKDMVSKIRIMAPLFALNEDEAADAIIDTFTQVPEGDIEVEFVITDTSNGLQVTAAPQSRRLRITQDIIDRLTAIPDIRVEVN